MKRSGFLLLLLLVTTVVFAGTIEKIDLAEVDDDSIEITSPVWDGTTAGPVLVGTFDSRFDRTVVRKLGGGFRNAMLASQTLAPQLDLGEVLATSIRAEGRKLGLSMMEPQEGAAPQWLVGGTIRDAVVEVQHMGYGSLLLYAYLDVDVSVAKQGAPATSIRMRPARLFVLFNAGMGTGDEAQLALTKMIVLGSQQILARLNRERFHAPALSSIDAKVAGLKKVTDQEPDLHHVGLSGAPGASAARVAMLEKEKDENARMSLVYALTDLGAAEHAPLLIRRYATEDTDVRYATLIALDTVGTSEALALIREKGTKDKNLAIKRLAERIVAEK
ncbi:MAG: HEAT repeat domain-containing protein [Thermoanaerobaculia bacterium]